ncbi:hypothetical protein MRX96_025043 [Rhipicephalus microplus]
MQRTFKLPAFYYVAGSASLASVAMGSVMGYSAPALASMAAQGVRMTRSQETWFGSVLAVGALGGQPGFVGGCLCIALCNASLPWMFVGRVLTGFCCGLVSLAVPVFVADISPAHVRGLLGSGVQLAMTLGVLAVFVSGKWLDWLSLALLCTVCPVLMAVAMEFAVESPRWLLAHGQRDKALDALRFLYGPKVCAEAECLVIEASILRQPTAIGDLFQRSFSLPLAYTLLLMFFQQFCGINVITFYAVKIFESSGSDISATDCTIMLGVVQVIASLAASLLIDRAGRRCLMLVSCLFVAASLTVLGCFFYYKDMDNGEFRHRYRYVPLASLTTYIAAFCLGIGPVPWVVMGEILSPRARGFSTGVSTAFCFFCEFLITKEFQDLIHLFNFSGLFWMFALVTILQVLFIYTCIPETKGKSLEDISQTFESLQEFGSSSTQLDPVPTTPSLEGVEG